jgi:hypothetical protein
MRLRRYERWIGLVESERRQVPLLSHLGLAYPVMQYASPEQRLERAAHTSSPALQPSTSDKPSTTRSPNTNHSLCTISQSAEIYMAAVTLSDAKNALEAMAAAFHVIPEPFKSAVSAIPKLALAIVNMAQVLFTPSLQTSAHRIVWHASRVQRRTRRMLEIWHSTSSICVPPPPPPGRNDKTLMSPTTSRKG